MDRLQKRREQDRAQRASETAEQKELRLRKRQERDRAICVLLSALNRNKTGSSRGDYEAKRESLQSKDRQGASSNRRDWPLKLLSTGRPGFSRCPPGSRRGGPLKLQRTDVHQAAGEAGL